ncbi:MAG: chromosome segregation protein SMC [candidate division WOR-3 bacterium]|nr:MAG: chromosome segregation protein SMC [candidate division WOR-3 bacterium]
MTVHIQELQLTGFKSFQEKSRLVFSSKLNAVIGPNGCGKTNVLDALRWVLGEQSFGLLRCAKNEDLIFGGTAQVPATNYAEVKLILANDGGTDQCRTLPEYGSEIEIKRRYFRSGESEYYLNRQECRLRDIQEVFLASGIGTKTYSTFDLRQMREIIAGHIRKMFEEAATLAKYREAKADCQRKLELTDKDLVRLDDIVAERERIVRSLQRQAGKLRSFDKLKSEEKGLRLIELKREFERTGAELERAGQDAAALEQAEANRLVEIRRLDQELHRHRSKLRQEQSLKDEVAAQVRQQRDELSELEGRNLLTKQKVEFLRESADRADAERVQLGTAVIELEDSFKKMLARIGAATTGQAEIEGRLEKTRENTRTAEQQLYALRDQEVTLRQNLESLLEQQDELRRRVARLEAAAQNRSETRVRLEKELAETKRRLEALSRDAKEYAERIAEVAKDTAARRRRVGELEEELRRNADELARTENELAQERGSVGELEKEQAVLRSLAPERVEKTRQVLGGRVLGELGRFLEIDEGWERAAEAALQPVADLIVVARIPTGPELVKLVEVDVGRGLGLLPVTAGGETKAADGGGRQELLSEHVRTAGRAPARLGEWLMLFRVAQSEDEMLTLARERPGDCLVTRSGCAVLADGRVYVAAGRQGRLSVERLLRENGQKLATGRARFDELTGRRKELSARSEKLRVDLDQSRETLSETERAKSSLDATIEILGSNRAELGRQRSRLEDEVGSLGADEESGSAEAEDRKAALAKLDARVEAQTRALRKVQTQVSEQEKNVKARLDESTARLAELSEERHKASRLEAERDFVRRTIEERRRRITELERSAAESRERAVEAERGVAERAPGVDEKKKKIAELEAKVDGLRVADLARVEEELERNLDELRSAREKNQGIIIEGRMRRHDLNQESRAIVQEAQSVYKTDIAAFQPEEVEDYEDRLEKVRRRLEELGRVNPLAREEHEQEKQDLERLQTQRQDVATARENLLQTMAEIDQHARERFVATYRDVRGAFREVFRQMFIEGEADLVLIDEQNPLESEIGIVAKPKGKNPKRLEQLSDGEKALLAVSLLFAFYRVKPAPFCFLDEIDAPLDDANVGRFADYLKELAEQTQVIIITHNRLTVERADVLFGVTAEQPGVSKLVSVSLADYKSSPVASSVS